MEPLKNPKMEQFCQIIATTDCDPATACLKAGYGGIVHPTVDTFHRQYGARLMGREDVQARIHQIRATVARDDQDFVSYLRNTLKSIVRADYGQFLGSKRYKLSDGREGTCYFLTKDVQDWPPELRSLLITKFDSKGAPVFPDKQWAIEKLLTLYGAYDNKSTEIEDTISLFQEAGLFVGTKADLLATRVSFPGGEGEEDL